MDVTNARYIVIDGNAYAMIEHTVMVTAMRLNGAPDHANWAELEAPYPRYQQLAYALVLINHIQDPA